MTAAAPAEEELVDEEKSCDADDGDELALDELRGCRRSSRSREAESELVESPAELDVIMASRA